MRQSINSLVILLCLLMAGCTSRKTIPPSPTNSGLLSEQEATDAALRIASTGQPEIELTDVKPTVIKARQSTLAKAIQETIPSSSVPTGYAASTPVWVITMAGEWKEGFPLPTGLPTPEPYHTYVVILDAKSGAVIIGGTQRGLPIYP